MVVGDGSRAEWSWVGSPTAHSRQKVRSRHLLREPFLPFQEMVVIELEPEPEPEEVTRSASPTSAEKAATAAGGEAVRPSASVPEEQVPATASGEAPRGEDEEEAFEDALTDEQLREEVSIAVLPSLMMFTITEAAVLLNCTMQVVRRLSVRNAKRLESNASLLGLSGLLDLVKARSQANDAKAEGNKLFAAGQYDEALSQYEMALQVAAELESAEDICSACHSNRAVCFLKLGKYDKTVKECTKALELNPSYLKALLRRAEAHEKLEHYDEAIADMKKILELDPSNQQAKRSLFRLEPLAAEKREKMKEEMIGKLKELGNSVLGRFGMSVDNFKAVKDPNTGSYSISFQK
ncbi:hypothetical protein EJB05_21907, partial [Eragrostis curvula]